MAPHRNTDSSSPNGAVDEPLEQRPLGASDGTDEHPRAPWTTLALMLLAQLMVILDISVVNVALPSIGRSLSFGSSDYQWVVSAYVLFSGGLLLFGGRLADLFDRRSMFLTGLVTFTLASLASGLTGSAAMLVAARAAQGAGGALLTPAALSIIMTAYTGRQRAAAVGIWGAIGSSGIALGVLLGGALTSALNWRAIFFINVPIGIAVAAATLRVVPRGAGRTPRRSVDAPGALTLVAGLVTLVLAIEATRTAGWSSVTPWALLALAAALLVAFARIERVSGSPLVPPRVWSIRSLVSSSAVMAGVTGVVVGSIFLTSLYLQRVMGASAIGTGLDLLPLAGAIFGTAAAASKVLTRVGPRAMIAFGVLVMGAGAVVMATRAGGTSYLSDVLPGLILLGAGVGPMFVAIPVAAMGDVPEADAGLGSGVMMTGHEVGAALGVSLLTAVAGDLTTRVGLIHGTPRAFWMVLALLGVVLLVTLAAVPRRVAAPAGQATMH